MELEQSRSRVLREEEVARAQLEGELAKQRIEAETAGLKLVGEATRYRLERLEAAQRERAQLEAQAGARLARYESEATAFGERVRAVAARGEQAVREAWIDALAGIELELAPYERSRKDQSEAPGAGRKP